MMHRFKQRLVALVTVYHALLAAYLILRFTASHTPHWLALLHTFALWLFAPLILLVPGLAAWHAKRTAGIAGLLLVLGLINFAPLPGLQQSDAPHDLRVLTYNLWDANPTISASIYWLLAQNADVVILQEMLEGHTHQLPRLEAAYPYHVDIYDTPYIFSRFPVLESEAILLEAYTANRGRLALRTVLDVNGTSIAVYGVHLTSPVTAQSDSDAVSASQSVSWLFQYNEERRNAQLRALIAAIQAETIPVIAAGDFNLSHTSPIIDEAYAANLQDSYRIAGTDWGMTWSHPALRLPILRIDYVWSTTPLRPLRMYRGDFNGSDHLPIVVDFGL